MSHSSVPPRRDSAPSVGFRSFVGKRIGPYTICMELASGGMATVFLAREDLVGGGSRLVALKVIHHHLLERHGFLEMFADEAHITSRLRHHNVCEVLAADASDDTCYLAMEYLMGEPLSAIYRRTARRVPDLRKHAALVVRVAVDACQGLHAAHELCSPDGRPLNVVHRDVSPENLFVTYAGVTKVVDFGLASAKHQTHRTSTGVLKGKFAYISPEALRGERPDRRADVWSLGVVVWELLTGRRLFSRGSDLQTLSAVAEAEIAPPSSLRPGLPQELDTPLLRALQRQPMQRQASAQRFAEELLAACPEAEQLGELQVFEWMVGMFAQERRWKLQVVELVEALSRAEPPSAGPRDDPRSSVATVPQCVSQAPSPSLGRLARPLGDRRVWVGAASLVAMLAVASAMTSSRSESREPPEGVSDDTTLAAQTPSAPRPAAEPAIVRAGSPDAPRLQAFELAGSNACVLELADPAAGKTTWLLRMNPPAKARPKKASPRPGPTRAVSNRAAKSRWWKKVAEARRPNLLALSRTGRL